MKALLKIALISGLMTLASCAHHRHGGCGPSDKCPMMGAKECKECCEKGKCDMKGAAATTTEEKKDETKK